MNNIYCVMTWKTFLNLFREDYNLFYFNGINWCYKLVDIKIILHYTNAFVPDNRAFFINSKEIEYGKI